MTRRRQFWTFMVASVLLNFAASTVMGGEITLSKIAALLLANASGIALITAGEKP